MRNEAQILISKSTSSSISQIRKIVDDDCCIGCGLCAYAAPSKIKMKLNEHGQILPAFLAAAGTDEDQSVDMLKLCPFSNDGAHENEISAELYSKESVHHPEIGYWHQTSVGHVTSPDDRLASSSGGLISWLCAQLLRDELVDGIIHVTPGSDDSMGPPLFHYSISRTKEEIYHGAKSKYYPIELSQVLSHVKSKPGRYALVGIPCFIKGARRLARLDQQIHEQIPYMIGLVCGHLKSRFFAELLAAQMGTKPTELNQFDFRVKLEGRSAGAYGVRARGSGIDTTRPSSTLFGTDWGLHFFRYGACDSCDDVFAETADVAIGDAWLPEYLPDWQGNSVIVSRHPLFSKMLEDGQSRGELQLDTVTPDQIALSQAGGLRDRREDNLWRRLLRSKRGQWTSTPRDFGKELPSKKRRKLIETRIELRRESFRVWGNPEVRGNPDRFIRIMTPLLRRYQRQVRGPLRYYLSPIRKRLTKMFPWLK